MRSIPDMYDPSSQVEFQKREKSEFGETKRDISRTTLVSNPNLASTRTGASGSKVNIPNDIHELIQDWLFD